MKKKFIIGCSIAALVLVSGGIYWKFFKSKPVAKVQGPVMPTVKVEKGSIEKIVFAKGHIYDASQKEINSEVEAIVERIFVKKGSVVKKGDLLFSMSKTNAVLEMETAQLNYETKRREYEKAKDTAANNTVKAAISGRITKLISKEGDKTDKDAVVAEMTDTDYLEVTAPFDPVNASKIQLHKKAKVFFVSSLSYIEGDVVKIDTHGTGSDGGGISHGVTVRFKNPGAVSIGDSASIQIALDEGTIVDSLETAKVKQPEPVKIKTKSGGVVSVLKVQEGDFVEKGTELMQMDVSDNEDSLKDLELALRRAELERDLKKKDLEKYDVYASQDGVASEVNIVVGQEPPTDKPAVIISGLRKLEMTVKVEEVDIPYIKEGQKAKVYVTAFENRPFSAEVIEISSQGKAEGNTTEYEVKLKIEDSKDLKVGMSGDADITVEKKDNILRLPVSAVSINGKTGTVMLQRQEGPAPIEVNIGIEADEYIEITDGLKEGDEVLMNSSGPVQPPEGVG